MRSLQTKGSVVCLDLTQEPQQLHVPEEDLRVLLLASPNTNWIVKTEKLLFGSVLINSGLQPVERHSLLKKQHVCYSLTLCVAAVSRPGSRCFRAPKCCSFLIPFNMHLYCEDGQLMRRQAVQSCGKIVGNRALSALLTVLGTQELCSSCCICVSVHVCVCRL